MTKASDKNYSDWFKKANEDELSIRAIFKSGGAFSTACFLSQQMTEKYLKGLLVFFDKPFLKIHDLLDLETALLLNLPEIQDLHSYLKKLNRYYTETRYPGDYPEFTFREAEEAFRAAGKIKEWVLSKITP